MSKVLFVVPFLPYPLISGGHQAIFNGLVAAAEAGAEIYITYPDQDDDEEAREKLSQKMGGKIHIHPFPMHINRKGDKMLNFIYRFKYSVKKLIKGEAGARPITSPYGQWLDQMMPKSDAYCQFINALVEQNAIDIVQCEMLETLAFALTLPKGVKKYFVHHELGFVRKGQHPFITQEPLAGPAHLAINQLIEINLLNQFDTVVTLSEVDSQKLRDTGVSTRIHSSFATVNHLPNTDLETTDSTILSFVGPEWHPSNKSGILWFLESCWEDLLSTNPEYRLQIIGRWTEETQREICTKYRNVLFPGYVDDLTATIKNTIMIVPITIGSGIRMKILEAGMIGVPIVTTSVGVEGIPLVNGENCFIGDTPEAFVQGILSLSDQKLRVQFIRSAQHIIEVNYSQHALNENRKVLY